MDYNRGKSIKKNFSKMNESTPNNASLSGSPPIRDFAKKNTSRMESRQSDKTEENLLEKPICQLKAAEARNRVRSLHSKYLTQRNDEIRHLISSQATAIKALRLESLLPVRPTRIRFRDALDKDQRERVESLLEDDLGLKTGRIIT